MVLDVIKGIIQKLEKYPELKYSHGDGFISVDPPSELGFSVTLSANFPGYTVGFDGWHEEFEDEGEALDCFAFGLSDRCRFRVTMRGNISCSWTVESRDGVAWKEDSTTGLILIPFWRKRSIVYRQNNVIVGEE